MNNNFLTNILPAEGGLEAAGTGKYNVVMAILGMLTLVGVGAGVHSLWVGHEHTFGVSRGVPWGMLIAAYVFFVVTSTGLCIVSSVGHVFGIKNFNPIAKRAVFLSIATIVAGFLVIAFEIENSWRMPVGNVIGANPTSNIWWMGTLYGAYLFFMLIEFVMLQKNLHKTATAFGLAGLLTGVAAHSNLGAVFGLLNGREFWHGPYMPIYFITSAAMSGCVAIIFFTYIAYKFNGWKMNDDMKKAMESVAKMGALMMAIIIFFTCWKMITGVTGQPPGKYEAMQTLLTGTYSMNFWGGEVVLGMIFPLLLILAVRGRNMHVLFIASLAGMIGIFFMRYDLVIVGQLVPAYHGMGLVDYPELLTYVPSLHENLVVVGGIAFCALLFVMGEKLFRGHLTENH
ncbi:NrfD/PsrC family molybdoenzyme membrane anchor subunit [Desulforhopalus singaporensis]|uniref:Prokaryotic molybdopterin-containing oxidoreductase family, membrane subunit n=1 Tax=Desulforhopalus singaporensis TaxID=91360 RepID=A0A1H0N5C0_9BACT|nr:NrfD/PsrC family molybdoenzyme membrane anchor subunit [Desulforhopalus singaporensis]SDO87843.1 prokaryotic molybdopterin-containing oxidoreductase family, membrane subunit [Desulforhopalus singaporensis]